MLIKKFFYDLISKIGKKFIIFYILFLIINYSLYSLQPYFISNIYNQNKINYIFLILLLISFLSVSILSFPNNVFLQKIRKYSKEIIWEKHKNRDYNYFSNINVGEFQNLVSEISFSARSLQYESLQTILKSTILLIIYTFLLSKFNILLGILYIILYIFYILLSILFLNKNNENIKDVLNASSKVNSYTIDFFRNIDTIFTNKSVEYEQKEYENLLLNEEKKYFLLQKKIDYSYFILQIFITFITIFLFIYSINVIKNINSSILLILIYSIFNLNGFGKELLATLEHKDRLKYALKKIEYDNYFNKKDYLLFKELDSNKILEVKNLFFSYKNKEIFNDLNFNVNKNDKVLILGNNGSGKSTLAKLISNFIYYDKGEIIYNKKYINKTDDILYYSQSMNLFDRSILDNIVYNNKNFDLEKIKYLIKVLKLDTLIKNDEDLYKKKPGDFGNKFSGGEKQKILIIRSLINPKPIMIYDEINSALDKDTLKTFYNLIDKFLKNCTVIIISHRNEDMECFNKKINL